MADIKLYGYATSPYVRKVGCFLYYKGLDFTFIPVSPMEAAQALEFIGGTQVPVLSIDGCLLYTSPSPRDLSTSRMPSSA